MNALAIINDEVTESADPKRVLRATEPKRMRDLILGAFKSTSEKMAAWHKANRHPRTLHGQGMRYLGQRHEAIDPKRVMHQMGQPRHHRPKQIKIIGRRWWRRTYGGTYHTADIYVDGEMVHTTPRQYGYGDQYVETAWSWLEHEGYIPKRERFANGGMEAPWRQAQDLGIEFLYTVYDVKRQRDL